jgi:hypothetical protein
VHREPPGPHPVSGWGGPVDARLGRVQQGATAIALLAGFVFRVDWLLPIWTVVLGLDVLAPPGRGPVGGLYRLAAAHHGGSARVVHPASRMRANALPEVMVLLVASLILALGAAPVSWILALVVAAGAAYSAATDTCVGCEITRLGRRPR